MSRLRTMFWLAGRDLRAQPMGFRLYALALALGMGAMIAVTSFRDSMGEVLDQQAKTLLGADLAVRVRREFTPTARAFLDRIPGARADESAFRTMAWFVEREQSRFVQVRALDGAFPFFGTLDTVPPDAAQRFQEEGGALVEEGALLQAGAEPGDTIRLGAQTFRIVGKLLRAPGETPSEAFIAPRVYIPLRRVEATGLIQPGSVASFRRYVKLPPGEQAGIWADTLRRELPDERLEIETAETRKRALLGRVDAFARYLALVGFVGLLLGCVGVAGAVHVYVTRRLPVVAYLRCLGAPYGFCEGVFLLQVLALALTGAAGGIAIAALVLPAVSGWMRDFLAVDVTAGLNARAALLGVAAGSLFSVGFAALPLLAVRRVTPLRALARFSSEAGLRRDPARLAVGTALALGVTGFAMLQTTTWWHGLALAGGLGVAFAVLALAARGLRAVARTVANRLPALSVRHGVAGLYRPNNQTTMMLAAIGLGAFLLSTLHVAERSLRAQLSAYRAPDQPTLVLIDVQPDQRAEAAATLAAQGVPLLNDVPIVTMRLQSLNGREVTEPGSPIPDWALRREYRGTYRSEMFTTESLLAGQWVPAWNPSQHPPGTPVPISMEESIAKTLGVAQGDSIVWDVQGRPLATRIESIREVDWQSMKPNFYVVFPVGVLEDAPQTMALFTRASDAAGSAALQRAVAQRFTNVSVIDLALVLSSVNTILGRIGEAVRSVALFALIAGLLVVAGAVRANREQREREFVLLRTLGAPRRHLVGMAVVEHAALGLLGGGAGTVLGALSGALVATYMMETEPVFAVPLLVGGVFGLTILTALLGWLGARGGEAPPLEQLRRLEV